MKSSPLSISSYLISSLLLSALFFFPLSITPSSAVFTHCYAVLLLPLSANCALSCFVNFNRGLRDLSQHGEISNTGESPSPKP